MKKALARGTGEHSAEDIKLAVKRKNMQLWGFQAPGFAPLAMAITEVYCWPSKRVCCVIYAATEIPMGPNFWRDAIGPIEKWARHHKCDSVRAEGRDGWAPVMAAAGYKKIHTTIEKDL